MTFAPRASFRDPYGSVSIQYDLVVRRLTDQGQAHWGALEGSGLASRLIGQGVLIGTDRVDAETLHHERVPFVSYAYEWAFTSLKRAALLHLDLILELSGAGLTLQDADPSNVQFFGGRPVFIDVTSITPALTPAAWPAFGQFCDAMLYPLLLESGIGLDWRPLLRARPTGLDVATVGKILGPRRFSSRTAFLHVFLRNILERAGRSISAEQAVSMTASTEASAGFRRMIERLRHTIDGLAPAGAARTDWGDYEKDCHYDPAATARKLEAVAATGATLPPGSMVIDLGANAGRFSRAVAGQGHYTVAIDGAADAAESIAVDTSAQERGRLLPLVMDLANASPDQGWAGSQYGDLARRSRADLVLALAVTHHLRVTENIPFAHQMAWLATLAPRLLIEFVAPEDAKSKQLLARRLCPYPDFSREGFEAALAPYYRIGSAIDLTPTRRLYDLQAVDFAR